jgi:hypothetical protein
MLLEKIAKLVIFGKNLKKNHQFCGRLSRDEKKIFFIQKSLKMTNFYENHSDFDNSVFSPHSNTHYVLSKTESH